MGYMLQAQKALDGAAELVEELKDPRELLELKKALATIVGSNFGDVMLPIIQQYPELNPYPKKEDR